MTYEDERQRILRQRMQNEGRYLATSFDQWTHHEGIPVSPQAYSELEQMQAMGHEYDYLQAAGFVPGVVHDRKGVYEGLDAREIAQRQSIVGLARASGYNRGNSIQGENIIDNPLGQNDNVRVFDHHPIPPGEYFVRPLSMNFDRIAMESFIISADAGFPFFAEYRNSGNIAAGASFRVPDAASSPAIFNHDHPIERVVIINDSTMDMIVAIDHVANATSGAPSAGGSGDFLVKPGETATFPVRCYTYVDVLNNGAGNIAADELRVQVYGYKDAHATVLRRGFGRVGDSFLPEPGPLMP
jgi:hypothetical protein